MHIHRTDKLGQLIVCVVMSSLELTCYSTIGQHVATSLKLGLSSQVHRRDIDWLTVMAHPQCHA